MSDIDVVYAVEWIEVEFGQRPEGYKLFVDKDKCIETTKNDSIKGPYTEGGYFGPIRPLFYYEIPFSCVNEEYQEKLKEKGVCFTKNWWTPRFKSSGFKI